MRVVVDEMYASTGTHRVRHDARIIAPAGEPVTVASLHKKASAMVRARAEEGACSAIPCQGWLQLQFLPTNLCLAASARHYGRVPIRRVMTSAVLRVEHPDGRYNHAAWRIIKGWLRHLFTELGSDAYAAAVAVYSLDDKATIPCGEPGMPVSTQAKRRGSIRGALTAVGRRDARKAADHDCQSICAIRPSVALRMQMRPLPAIQAGAAWYSGSITVSLKDAAFEHSHAFRHAAEIGLTLLLHADKASGQGGTVAQRLLRSHDFLPACLVLRTDGGSDHNCTFLAVQLSMVALFLAAQLDQLVLARTAPSASVYNDAEKAMGHLNVALLGANTARSRMAECHEEKMSKCENRKAVREGGSDAAFKQAFAASMQAPIGDIGARMSQLRNVEVTQPADEGDISSLYQLLRVVQQNFDPANMQKKHLAAYPNLRNFLHTHSRRTKYMLVLSKCRNQNCYCRGKWRNADLGRHLNKHDPPLPAKQTRDSAGHEHYARYAELAGKPTDERNLPSLLHGGKGAGWPELVEADKAAEQDCPCVFSKNMQCKNVAHYVRCMECNAARCIRVRNLDSRWCEHVDALVRHASNVEYQCGDDIFAGATTDGTAAHVIEELARLFVVQRAITASVRLPAVGTAPARDQQRHLCGVPTDNLYYAHGPFPLSCAWCAEIDPEEFVDEDAISALGVAKRARPICRQCHEAKKPVMYYGRADQTRKCARSQASSARSQASSGSSGGSKRKAKDTGNSGMRKVGTGNSADSKRKGKGAGTGASKAGAGEGRNGSKSSSSAGDPGVGDLIRDGYLTKFPATGKNGVCESCENTGVLVECYSCNIVWHRGCIPAAETRPDTDHLLASPDDDWVCGSCLDEARGAYLKQMQQPRVLPLGPRQRVRDHGGMAEIAIVSVHTGLKNRYLCSLRATPGIVEAAYRNKAPRASAGAVVGWGPLLANCIEPHAAVGDTTLRQLGIQAGSTTTVHAELCARGSGEGSGSGSSGSGGKGSDSNKRKSNGNGGHQRRVERKGTPRGILDDSSDSDEWQQPLVRLRRRGNKEVPKRKRTSGANASGSDSDSDDTRLVCSRGGKSPVGVLEGNNSSSTRRKASVRKRGGA